MIDDNLPWLWVCSECGACWLAATDNDTDPGTACPDAPVDHAGACFAFELYPDDMDRSMIQAINHHIPDDGAFADLAFWPVGGYWSHPLNSFPILTGAAPPSLSQRDSGKLIGML